MNYTLDPDKKYTVTLRCGGTLGPVVYDRIDDQWKHRSGDTVTSWNDSLYFVHRYKLSPFDIVDAEEIKEPKVIEGWINIYDRCSRYSVLYITREEADKNAHDNRIACVKLRCTEGEGLT